MFNEALTEFQPKEFIQAASQASANEVRNAFDHEKPGYYELALFLSPAARPLLEEMAVLAHEKTVKRFGHTMSLFTPLYVSNDCINSCAYCSFNRHLNIDLKTLTMEELENECKAIKEEGFSHLLLVSSENPQKAGVDYLKKSVEVAKKYFEQVVIEFYTLDEESYKTLKNSGVDGVTLFQETYSQEVYARFHPAGPKKDFEKRLKTMDMAARAGIKKLNLGSLLGLNDFREEALYLAFHANYLKKNYWQSEVAISFPRIRKNTGNFQPPVPVSDADFAQMILAMRLFDENLSLVLSTRETESFRNSMARLGITSMSAGAKTNPGGYTGKKSESQFKISDERTPSEISKYLESIGYDVVWKDWEYGI